MDDQFNPIFKRFSADTAAEVYSYFSLRRNKTSCSTPIEELIWSSESNIEYAVIDEKCMILRYSDEGRSSFSVPFCRIEELTIYFKSLEKYVNETLHSPLNIGMSDEEAVDYLKSEGLLEGYDVGKFDEIYDYIYDAEALRTLAGKKLSKKRNHIHIFERENLGRWEYRPLGWADREEISLFLNRWMDMRPKDDEAEFELGGYSYSGKEYLEMEHGAVEDILQSEKLCGLIKMGGIYIDGRMEAFALGSYNPLEKMAVINIEKADPAINGLYQMINREFLCREFPEAETVNREDDAGDEGLRRSKLSYYPIYLEKYYSLKQNI